MGVWGSRPGRRTNYQDSWIRTTLSSRLRIVWRKPARTEQNEMPATTGETRADQERCRPVADPPAAVRGRRCFRATREPLRPGLISDGSSELALGVLVSAAAA